MSIKENWLDLKQYLKEVWIEGNPKNGNVVWPNKKEIGTTTIVVLVFLVISAVYIGLVDFAFSKLLKLIF